MNMGFHKYLEFLGLPVEDKVTGFKGVVTSVSFDLYGCIQAIVNPGIGKDNKPEDSMWFDIARLRILGIKPVMTQPNFLVDKGPAEKPLFNKA